jgi:hypothetical protein
MFCSLKRMKCSVHEVAHKNHWSSIREIQNLNMPAKDREIRHPYLPCCQLIKETKSNLER